MRPIWPVLAFALAPLVACGTDAADPADDPRLGGDLVGTWRGLPNAASPIVPPPAAGDLATFRFAADGTMTFGTFDRSQEEAWTYELDGDRVALTIDATHTHGAPYRATATRLVFDALVPADPAAGLVNSWTATIARDGVDVEVGLDIRADGTATVRRYYIPLPDETYEATWTAVGDDVLLTAASGPRITVTRIDGLLGSPFERIP